MSRIPEAPPPRPATGGLGAPPNTGSAVSRPQREPNIADMKMAAEFADITPIYHAMRENAEEIARTRKAMFDAYKGAGFTEAQALELIKGSLLP